MRVSILAVTDHALFDLAAAEGAFGLQELPQLELPGRWREVDTEVLRRYEFTGGH